MISVQPALLLALASRPAPYSPGSLAAPFNAIGQPQNFGTGASRFAAARPHPMRKGEGDAETRARRRLQAEFQRQVRQDKVAKAAAGEYDRAGAAEDVARLARSAQVVVFSCESGEESSKAARLLRLAGAEPRLIDLDPKSEEGAVRRAELHRLTGCAAFPSVWIGGEFVGGCHEGPKAEAPGIVDLAFSGSLREKLDAAAAAAAEEKEKAAAASRDESAALSASERRFKELRYKFFFKAAVARVPEFGVGVEPAAIAEVDAAPPAAAQPAAAPPPPLPSATTVCAAAKAKALRLEGERAVAERAERRAAYAERAAAQRAAEGGAYVERVTAAHLHKIEKIRAEALRGRGKRGRKKRKLRAVGA
mmetsp:Transcript_24532/g.72788  ORF Transcript_24532/g.72788 Transcript_24532/m.72788 type:complete len:364 (+) Transcript_24532:24-1115(+)